MPVDPNSRYANSNPTPALPPSFQLPYSSTVNDHSSSKVKLLCSFGGSILPRPSDGALRYAGGHTRIISVSRDTSLPQFYRKMVEVCGGPVAIRYQLPDEGLDALISVSSAEDLDNMMDEYDTLKDALSDGSEKLRVFLFSFLEMNSAAGITGIDQQDSTQRYIEAINGAGNGRICRKDSRPSASIAKNSNVLGDGSKNEGMPSTVAPPGVTFAVSHDLSRATFVGNAISETENRDFPANSTVVGQSEVTANSVNQPLVAPYDPQAKLEPQPDQHVTSHSVAMAGGPQLINVVAVPPHPYFHPMHIPLPSVPFVIRDLNHVQGQAEPYFDGDQKGGRATQLISNQNYHVLQHHLSQLPFLHPSKVQPQSAEQNGLHLLPTLQKGMGFRLEDCQMCQKALPHAHSDMLKNMRENISGISADAGPTPHNHHSEDKTGIQERRENSVSMTGHLVEPKDESIVTPGLFGSYGIDQISEETLEKEMLVVPNEEGHEHSKSKQVMDPVGSSGDTESCYTTMENTSQTYCEFKLQQQPQVIHGGHFDHTMVLHHPITIGLSSSSNASYGVSFRPPQPLHDDSLQQKMVPPGEQFMGVFFGPLQHYRDDSQQQQQLLQAIAPPSFAVKQDSIQKQLGQGFSSKENIECKAPELLSNSVQVFTHDNVKPVEGMMETLHVNSSEFFGLNERMKSAVPSLIVSKELEPENSKLIGEQNNVIRHQNGAKQVVFSNNFVNTVNVPEVVSVRPLNPIFPNIGISKDMKPEISSMVGMESSTVRQNNGGNALLSSYAVVSSGILPQQNHTIRFYNGESQLLPSNTFINPAIVHEVASTGPVNPIFPNIGISKDIKHEISCAVGVENNGATLHNDGNALLLSNAFLRPEILSECGNTTHISTSIANHGLCSHNFERNAKPSVPHDVMPGITPSHTNNEYRNPINEPPDKEQKDEAAVFHLKDLDNAMAALPTGNAPFQFSYSNYKPGHTEQLVETTASDSFFNSQDHWKAFGGVHMCPSRPTILPNNEPVLKTMFLENFLPDFEGQDIAVLLKEGAVPPPVNTQSKDSHPEPFQDTQGLHSSSTDYVKQHLGELSEQVTSATALNSLEPNESSQTSSIWSRTNEDMANPNNLALLGNQLEDMKIKQSDTVLFGVPLADGIGRLQIIKNSDLEELRELGSGTFGTVFHGKWRGSDVAIKRINDRCFAGKPSEQERMRADFWNEASKLADLHHPNVVAFYGIVLDGPGGSFATVTEYMVNGSLRNSLQSNEKALDRRKRLLIATDVAFGMEYLHGKNIVHFDLKSDNLLVNLRDPQRPICKVADLGLSKVKCKTLISGGVRGTLPWMAPELLNGSSSLVSEKVDVFSFGIVMWELLTGQEPYVDLHYGAIIGGIVNNTLRPPVPESCDPEWKALMEQCWSAEPSRRPTFTEIAHRLRCMAASISQKAQAPTVQMQPQA